MNEAGMLVGAVLGVLVTACWHEWQVYSTSLRLKREECGVRGHQWGEPFGGMGGMHRNCRHCKRQEHQSDDGTWI